MRSEDRRHRGGQDFFGECVLWKTVAWARIALNFSCVCHSQNRISLGVTIRTAILEEMHAAAAQTGKNLAPRVEDDTPLLQSGLDSLGFAILVTRLEIRLGYDPFTLMEEPVYPRTVREFVAIYDAHKHHAKPSP